MTKIKEKKNLFYSEIPNPSNQMFLCIYNVFVVDGKQLQGV